MKDDARINARVFLVGCPRSGTTVLQSLLSSHSAIHSFPETHFLDQLFHDREDRYYLTAHGAWPSRTWRQIRANSRKALVVTGWVGARRSAKAWSGIEDDRHVSSLSGLRRFRLQAHTSRFVDVLDEKCRREGKRIWLEKTPNHLFHVDRIQGQIAQARTIHIVRDGTEVVTSLHRMAQTYPGWHPYLNIERAIERWNAAWRESLSWRDHPDHLLVRYETLLADPESTVARVLQFLNCPMEVQVMDSYTHSARNLVRSDEPWKDGNFSEMGDRRKFMDTFDDSQRARIIAGLDKPDWDKLSRLPQVVA